MNDKIDIFPFKKQDRAHALFLFWLVSTKVLLYCRYYVVFLNPDSEANIEIRFLKRASFFAHKWQLLMISSLSLSFILCTADIMSSFKILLQKMQTLKTGSSRDS